MNKQMILYDNQRQVFHLMNDNISYVFEIVEDSYLAHRHWGKRIESYSFSNKPTLKKRTFAAMTIPERPEFSLEYVPQEVSFPNQGDYREPSVQIRMSNGYTVSRFGYEKFEISDGAPEFTAFPHARDITASDSQTLTIHLVDPVSSIRLLLFYTIFEDADVIIRSSKIINESRSSVMIEKLSSASIDMRYDGQLSTTFYGTHQKEYQLNRQPISHGKFSVGSNRGASGPQYPPYLSISKDATEFAGDVHAMTLIYSGNHLSNLERDQYNHLRLQIGLNPDTFAWQLGPGESFQSPQAVLSFSDKGYNGNSNAFHQFFNKHLIPQNWVKKPRPVLVNSWEMSYFDVSEKIMKDLIDSAKEMGFETVVLDDGWFGERTSSKTSLGDWQVDANKFPNGIKPLVDYAKEQGLQFGIWFEPEMISPNSDLVKSHPDWVMRTAEYEPLLGRSQYILDLTNAEVQTFIIDLLTRSIEDFGVSYIKWDMNRHMTDPASNLPNRTHANEYSHRYMLGLYRILDTITTLFPEVLFENCSSGGGRLDPGMLYFMPQTWASDNTDGLDRQRIQYGVSYLFPPYSLTGHVSSVPNHQTGRVIDFETRKHLASSTNMGYEMDIMQLSDHEKAVVKAHVEGYKEDRDFLMASEFYRLESPFDTNHCTWMFTDEARNKIIVYLFRNTYDVSELSFLIKIPFIDLKANYVEVNSRKQYSGSELANCGIALENPIGDHLALRLDFEKC